MNPEQAPEDAQYRVLRWRDARVWGGLIVMAVLLGVAGWAGIAWTEARLERIETLAETSPRAALRESARLLWWLAGATLVVSVGIGAYVVWYGRRVIDARTSPPPGSWKLASQPVFRGAKAVRLGWYNVVLGLVLTVLGFGALPLAERLIDVLEGYLVP